MPRPVNPKTSLPPVAELEVLLEHGFSPEFELVGRAVRSLGSAADLIFLARKYTGINEELSSADADGRVGLLQEGLRNENQVQEMIASEVAAWCLVTRDGTGEAPVFDWLKFLESRMSTLIGNRSSAVIAAFSEIIDNAWEHGRSAQPHLLTFELSPAWWIFSVTDGGPGIPETIRSLPKFAHFSDYEAVAESLHAGISCTGRPDRGEGFRNLIRVLVGDTCRLYMRTGRVSAFIHGNAQLQRLDQMVFRDVRVGLHLRARGGL